MKIAVLVIAAKKKKINILKIAAKWKWNTSVTYLWSESD